MSNFFKFISEDIEAKKILFSTMPTNTKRDKKKFNEKINSVSEKYIEYKAKVKKYIDTKSKTFNVKKDEKNLEDLNKNILNLERVRFILNPSNTYFEKIGLDKLLYQISNYYDFNFNSLNDIINQFLNKFEEAGIKLKNDDFSYTCYVHEYMTSLLEIRNKNNENYDKLSEIFEKIYWVNPEIVEHIELNFRKLIRKNEKHLTNYINKLQKEVMQENNIINFEDCLKKLKGAYAEANEADKEHICDIIDLAKNESIDINNYFEDSKTRVSAYSDLMINPLNHDDTVAMDKFYDSLRKLKTNLEEYSNYLKFVPLFDNFKKEYEKLISNDDKNANKDIKNIESQIKEKESKLEKINKKIFRGEIGFFDFKKNTDIKQLKVDSIKLAQELYELYKKHDQEFFKGKVLSILDKFLTISELMYLYYSFDYFKKVAIKKVFEITDYEEVIKYSDDFDLYAMNPTNIVIKNVALFEKNDIDNVIMNKYRLDNINLTEESLGPDELEPLLEKIQFLLRINEIEKSSTTVEKIWFMTQVQKFEVTENKNK